MEVQASDVARDLVQAEVVEPGKGRTLDATDVGVWVEEELFPAHEKILVLEGPVLVVAIVFGVIRDVDVEFAPRREPSPVLDVVPKGGLPRGVSCLKGEVGAYHFTLEERHHERMGVREVVYREKTRQRRRVEVHLEELHLHLIPLAARFLVAREYRPRLEDGRVP